MLVDTSASMGGAVAARSRIRHVEMRRSLGATGPMREEYEADPRRALRTWVQRRLDYHQRAASYFAARPEVLLVIDICTNPDTERACASITGFLGISPRAGLSLPHENAQRAPAAAGIRSKPAARVEVEEALREMGLPASRFGDVFP